jgi:phosphate transport system protein
VHQRRVRTQYVDRGIVVGMGAQAAGATGKDRLGFCGFLPEQLVLFLIWRQLETAMFCMCSPQRSTHEGALPRRPQRRGLGAKFWMKDAMQSEHIVRSFDEELKYLANRIAGMGGHAERMVDQAVSALVNSDAGLARKVIEDDAFLDEGQREIDERAIVIIAKRQPMADDLREIIGAIRISADLERVGDLGKNIAKRVVAVSDARHPFSLFRGLKALAELALTQLKDVLDAYASRSVERLGFVRDRDDQIDAMYTSLFRELLTYMMEDPRNITACTHLLFCAKNIERIGDHATNIAETVYYVVTGDKMPPDRPKEDKSHKVVLPTESAT